ncbi:MAG: hypothetical protein H7833_05700 [Magnetococcus sp. DMHC-1]|nr:hypothetical protein [Magnetococcales bacterium]
MAGLAFDTLKYTKRLKDAGVAAPQAEIQAEFLAEMACALCVLIVWA